MLIMKNSFIVFIIQTLIALCIDLFFFFLLEKPMIYATLCVFAREAIHGAWYRVGTLMVLISCQFFIYVGSFGLPLLYLLPIAYVGRRIGRSCYVTPIYPYAVLITCLLAQRFFIEHLILRIPITPSYTITTIFANIVILTVFSWFSRDDH